jgi:hypothetical protein
MIFEFLSGNILPALKSIFVDSGLLGAFAPKLGEELASTYGQYATAKIVPTSAPGLVESVREDPRYIEALKGYIPVLRVSI